MKDLCLNNAISLSQEVEKCVIEERHRSLCAAAPRVEAEARFCRVFTELCLLKVPDGVVVNQ